MKKYHSENMCHVGSQVLHFDLPCPGGIDECIGKVEPCIDRSDQYAEGCHGKIKHQQLSSGKEPEDDEEEDKKEQYPDGGVIVHTAAFHPFKHPFGSPGKYGFPESTSSVVKVGDLHQYPEGVAVGNITKTGRLIPGFLCGLVCPDSSVAPHKPLIDI
jgi:hypothetical protein